MNTASSPNTARPLDEFDAARSLVETLKWLPPDAQARAVKYAQEKLKVAGSLSPPGGIAGQGEAQAAPTRHELTDLLEDPTFVQRHGVVNRMLDILSAAYKLKPALFDKLLSIRGRNRCYFAKSEEGIANSGNSTQPRNIPGTGYWIMTNSPTSQKQDMLEQALRVLGFSPEAIKDAVDAIEKAVP